MIENGPKVIKPKNITEEYSTITLGAGLTAYSDAYDLVDLDVFALIYQAACTGTPNVKLELEQSYDNSNWFVPDTIANLNPSLTDKNLHGIKLSPVPVRYLRAKVTEQTGSVTDTVVTVRLSVQKRFSV